MRTETTTRTLYEYDELSDKGKAEAVEGLYDINVDYAWHECIYEDAANVGLKITSFDTGRRSSCKIDYIGYGSDTAHKIEEEHGEECDTYIEAIAFLAARDELVNTAPRNTEGDYADEWALDEKLDELEAEYLKQLSESYRIMLQKEYEYLISKEAIVESIKANEYEFTEDGKLA